MKSISMTVALLLSALLTVASYADENPRYVRGVLSADITLSPGEKGKMEMTIMKYADREEILQATSRLTIKDGKGRELATDVVGNKTLDKSAITFISRDFLVTTLYGDSLRNYSAADSGMEELSKEECSEMESKESQDFCVKVVEKIQSGVKGPELALWTIGFIHVFQGFDLSDVPTSVPAGDHNVMVMTASQVNNKPSLSVTFVKADFKKL